MKSHSRHHDLHMHLLCSYQLVNCPVVICSPSMLVIYHGETPLVNCRPQSIFYIWNTIYCNHLLSAFPTSNFHHPHYTINPLRSASRWDWQPHCYVGAKFFGCVVRRCLSKSYWFDNLGFFWGKTCCYTHHTFLLGYPNGCVIHVQALPLTSDK